MDGWIKMRREEFQEYEIIKSFIEGEITRKQAAAKLSLSERVEHWTCSTSEAVQYRYFASAPETESFMGVQAFQDALEEAEMRATDLDLIISASASKVQPIPCSAAAIHRDLGHQNSGIPCFDVDSTCLSFLTA